MPENYVLLERTELNASAASVTFANIPQTGYTDLVIKLSSRADTGGPQNIGISFNGSTTGFTNRLLYGDGSAAASSTTSTIYQGIVPGTAYTSNVFGNAEIYIPNYTGSTNKSYTSDSVTENNATASYTVLSAGLWSNTAAITSITLNCGPTSNWVSGSTFSLYGIAAVGTTPAIAPKASGGNIIDYDGTYWIHTFLTSGTFTPQTGLTCDYLVVAGGGGGGSRAERGGGGGAGGLRSTVTATGGGGSLETALTLSSGTNYTVTVGGGGAINANGSNSVFSTITSTGGGRGGFGTGASTPNTGGSGGGGMPDGNQAGAAGTVNQGYAGGSGATDGVTYGNSGGGGGAGGTGVNGFAAIGSSPSYQSGGAGVASSISGSSVTRAGGGGGGGDRIGLAGTGGGNGGNGSTLPTAATVNLGGGGGGSSYTSGNPGTAGGSGVVIIRYPAA